MLLYLQHCLDRHLYTFLPNDVTRHTALTLFLLSEVLKTRCAIRYDFPMDIQVYLQFRFQIREFKDVRL